MLLKVRTPVANSGFDHGHAVAETMGSAAVSEIGAIDLVLH